MKWNEQWRLVGERAIAEWTNKIFICEWSEWAQQPPQQPPNQAPINQTQQLILLIDWFDLISLIWAGLLPLRNSLFFSSTAITHQLHSNQKSLIWFVDEVNCFVDWRKKRDLLRHLLFHLLILICLPFPLQTKQIKQIERKFINFSFAAH